ncbi:ABC transporter permease [Ekhidna sp.]|uniref:ABC transporter permease n=1 Tax=Ekhidna sp. TaxID=2608089 RepID=UPI003297A62D
MSEPKNIAPPQWALRFFRWFCHPDYVEDIEGDLSERFGKRANENKAAKWLFTLDVLKLFRPGIIRPVKIGQKLNNYDMISNYYKVSIRNILRNKTFSFLNISGLSVGIASCILILIYVNNELSYDTYNSKYENIYRVIHNFGSDDEKPEDWDSLPTSEYQVWGNAPVAPAMQQFFPEVDKVFRFTSDAPWLFSYNSITYSESDVLFADSTALDIFDWKVIAGNPKTALERPNTVVLTQRLAEKYFGKENPIGKSIIMDNQDPYEVTGVVEVPTNSHFSFNALISMSTFRNSRPQIFDSWGYVDFYTYFTLKPGTSIEQLQEKVPEFLAANFPNDFNYHIEFEPLSDAYLHSDAGRQPGPVGSMGNIYIFTSVAIFILLIACINFMNLSTARSVERAKEVAIRKTIGSHRSALIYQFLVEAILVTFIASIMASILVFFGHSLLEQISGKALPIEWLFSVQNVLIAIGAILFIGIVAGSYPAFVLSTFKPITVLKGAFKSSSKGIWLRKSLVVLQFALSIILLAGAAVVSSQLDFLQRQDLGFNSEQVLVIDFGYDGVVQRKREYIKQQFLNHKDVEMVSISRATPGDFFPNAGTGVADPNTGEITYKGPAIYEVDEDFIPTYQMTMVAGRNFSDDFPLDSANALILNESAAKLFGYPDPNDIIGQSFEQWGRDGKVIGVVEDFNYVSLHKEVEPLSIRFGTQFNVSVVSLKLNSQDYSKTLSELESIWTEIVPHRPFDTRFANQNFDAQYEADERFGMIFSVFSTLAIFVACLGLFGLTIYSTAQRNKEIGVRKVLGASTGRIIALLSKDFIRLYIIALAIAIPFSWYLMNNWLDGFAYRIPLGYEVFVISAAITLIVAFVTMSFKTVSAALANPVESLRDE